ncbi:lecithin retinol acyltransferase [Leuresthes tenuis]|uniref:lecithin retinol acyltransferase n=1 Tax=Leuresthes tenuis TaxID=355514 RepID=UPI003B502B7E
MLDTLTFLLERLFLLAHIKLSSLLPPLGRDRGEPQSARRTERDEPLPQKFQRGDLLEVPRTLFTHFGIYLGDNRVAHLIPDILPVLTADSRQIQEMVTNTRLLLGVLSKRASIRVDSVEDFAYGAGILLNAMDRAVRRSPLPGEEVARRAERLVGSVSYSLLWNNCEHFVTYCRYGTAQSLQTDQFCEWLKSLIRDQRSVVLTALLGLLSMVYLGVSTSTTLPTLLIPFTLWMAS